MSGNQVLKISDITDTRLIELAKKFDIGGTKGVLEGKELINFKTAANAMLNATPAEIAQNIENLASENYGAADNIEFQLWVDEIDKKNAIDVFNAYKKDFNGHTPINAIIEERKSSPEVREKLILGVLNAIVGAIGEDKINRGVVEDFKKVLKDELYGYGMASAGKLNKYVEKLLAGLPPKGQEVQNSTPFVLNNVRPNMPELSLGKKYGDFSWQYSGLKNIKSIQDVSKVTGLSLSYLNELVENEGNRSKMYLCSSNKKTIGIGHNFESAKSDEAAYLAKTELAPSETYQILAYDLIMAMQTLQSSKKVNLSELTQGQFEALVDVAFNAPSYIKNLTAKTNQAIALKASNPKAAAKLFDEAAFEFNQQISNNEVAPGLCKRRIQNVMRFTGAKKFSELPANSKARERISILALNGFANSSFLWKFKYKKAILKSTGMTEAEYGKLAYPQGYKKPATP